MTTIVIATPDAVLVVWKGQEWTVEAQLEGMKAQPLAADESGGRLYVGRSGNGLYRSAGGGHIWEKVSFPQDNHTFAVPLAQQAGLDSPFQFDKLVAD